MHVDSNHPKNIIDQIPKSISKRISTNSSDKTTFAVSSDPIIGTETPAATVPIKPIETG